MTTFALMMTDKHLRIVTTGHEGPLSKRCRHVLERVGRNCVILGLTFFIDADSPQTFDEGEKTILGECRSFSG